MKGCNRQMLCNDPEWLMTVAWRNIFRTDSENQRSEDKQNTLTGVHTEYSAWSYKHNSLTEVHTEFTDRRYIHNSLDGVYTESSDWRTYITFYWSYVLYSLTGGTTLIL